MNKKEALEKIESLKAALPAASEEIDEIVKVLSKPLWHNGRTDEPKGEDVECLVMVGTEDKTNKPCFEVLKWDDKQKGFIWWNEEYNQNCLYPVDNFMLWAYMGEIINLRKLQELLDADDTESDGLFKAYLNG